jgi:hypothetical protein
LNLSLEALTGIYVLLSILAAVQITRKRRSAFVIGLLSQLVMIGVIILDPKLYWFMLQMVIYGGINIAGLRSSCWKGEKWF